MTDFLNLTKQAYESSSAFFDTNHRADLDYSLRAFRNEHASGSKYLSEEYKSRSRLFRPKTRAIIRKTEAAGAVAFFSSMEVVNVTPGDPDEMMSVVSASCMKAVLEHRLTKTIPAFQLVMGALQDAQSAGMVCSYNYWEYQKRGDKKIKDKPCIELRPIENIRLDGGANWIDPVGTSPYFCDIVPMYVCDVKGLMNTVDDKTNQPKWKKFDDSVILKARPDVMQAAQSLREGKKQSQEQETTGIKHFDIVWVMRWFMKDSQGEDFTYYTLGTEELLSDPKPLQDVYFHGVRPYTMGYSVLETHKVYKTSVPTLIKPLQQEANDIQNQRLDNVKFVLNKRWLVARGRQVDVQSLVRNVPGGVTLTTDPNIDVKESNWPDVTSSAYVEQDRVTADLDDLAGNFSPSTRVANNAVNDTLGGSKMANMSAGIMTDYNLRTFVETWYEPTLRQLVLLERYYESDEIVLRTCAKKARLFPKFGPEQLSEMIEVYECDINVNIGMGASDPNARLQKFIHVTGAVMQLILQAPPGVNVKEMAKEMFSMAGYRDGARFISEQEDPRLLKALQMLQQMKGMLEGKQMEFQAKAMMDQQHIASAERIKAAELQVDQARIGGDLQIRQAELAIEQQRIELEGLKLRVEVDSLDKEQQAKMVEISAKVEEAQLKLEGEKQKLAAQQMKDSQEIEKSQLELETVRAGQQNESKIGEVANQVTQSMQGVAQEIAAIKSGLNEAKTALGEIETLKQGMGAMAGFLVAPKKKAKSFKFNKPDGKKTTSVQVTYDDGSSEELAVN